MFGDWIEQLDIELGVVLRQRLVAVVVDELNDGAEGQRVRKAVLPIPMEYLNELVVSSFPVDEIKNRSNQTGYTDCLKDMSANKRKRS